MSILFNAASNDLQPFRVQASIIDFAETKSPTNFLFNSTLKATMPNISFLGQSVECEEGSNLRRVLLDVNLPLYNGSAGAIHCRGLGTCGTCAVEIEGVLQR